MPNYAVVVQCFNKPDTLEAVCRALLACSGRERFDLIFWSDSPIGSRNEERYLPAHRDVLATLEKLRPDLEAAFASVEIHGNTANLGPYKTCQLAVDQGFRSHDFVVFTEDDGIFEPDALEWFLACRRTEAFASERVWAISGESSFFEAQTKTVDSAFVQAAVGYALAEQLGDKYAEIGFIPSTCFATSAAKWAQIGETRGEINGDVTLAERCKAEHKTCIQPIVARVRDIGMLHDLGWSVSIHSKAGVTEIKNTYVASSQLYQAGTHLHSAQLIDPSRTGDIYHRTTMLHGFDNVPAPAPLQPGSPPPAAAAPILQRTLAMIESIKPGTYLPDDTKCYDEAEIRELGVALTRLLYAPSQIRKKLESYGASIVPANFYSEVPTQADLEAFFAADTKPTYGAIFSDAQLLQDTLRELTEYSRDFDPPLERVDGQFFWENDSYSYSDAMSYYAMIRKVKPKTIIEIGCGWSTMVADIALQHNGFGRIIGIEPYPPAFLPPLSRVTLVKKRVQDIDVTFFNENLTSGDILFIDSTHTVKHGSDCLHLYLSIVPHLSHRLFIHAHDIFLPNTLSLEAMRDRQIYWTEQYLLYAYLLNNSRTQTLFGSAYNYEANRELLDAFMHGRYGSGGGSFWFLQTP